MKRIAIMLIILCVLVPLGCMSAAQHQKTLSSTTEREATLGIVQKEIRIGMNQADVASALGSPNIVTKDSEGKETWIYDKVATEATYSRGSTGILFLIGIVDRDAGAVSSTQRTLTVVIKFNKNGQVDSTSYHSSKF